MPLTDNSVMQTITDSIGASWTNLAGTIDTTNAASAISKLTSSRQLVQTAISDADYLPADTLAGALHGLIVGLPVEIQSQLSSVPYLLNNYIAAVTGQTFRNYYKIGVTWNSGFKSLWRLGGQELIARLGTLTNTAGTWGGFVSDQTIILDTPLEVHTPSGTGALAATLTLHVTTQAISTPQVITLNIPASTPSGTILPINTALKFNAIVSGSVTGGQTSDVLEVWTS